MLTTMNESVANARCRGAKGKSVAVGNRRGEGAGPEELGVSDLHHTVTRREETVSGGNGLQGRRNAIGAIAIEDEATLVFAVENGRLIRVRLALQERDAGVGGSVLHDRCPTRKHRGITNQVKITIDAQGFGGAATLAVDIGITAELGTTTDRDRAVHVTVSAESPARDHIPRAHLGRKILHGRSGIGLQRTG